MHDILRVTMVYRLEQAAHVAGGLVFTEGLVLLLCNFIKEGLPSDVFHDQVDELFIVVGLVVLDDVGVIEGLEDSDLTHDVVNVVA